MNTNKNITRLIGDIHGNFYDYQTLCIDETVSSSIQLGDFAIGFGQNDFWHDNVNSFHEDGTHRFIRGNHDNPAECKKMSGWIKDGTVENDIMFVGGAWSIDHLTRIPGVDWWRDEELSYNDLDTVISVYEAAKPRVMITHDCPTLASYHMFIRDGDTIAGKVQYLTRTGEALQTMFEIHQPDFWFFGHWHNTKEKSLNGTTFVCLDELDYIDVDLSDSDQMSNAVRKKFNT